MEDMIASIIEQISLLRQTKVDPAIEGEILEMLAEADDLVESALHLATEFDPES